MRNFRIVGVACLVVSVLLPEHVLAHATVLPKVATQGSYQRLAFGVTHGCEGSATVEVIIQLPESMMGTKPMPKAGWAVETEVKDLAQPYVSHGKEIRRDVRTVRWRGKLLDAHYDEFVVMTKVWNKLGSVPIPVTQICEKGRMDWNQLPDGSGERLDYPAPALEIMPGDHRH